MTIDVPFELNDDVYAIYYETDNQPRIERVRVRGVLVTASGVFVCTRDGGEHLLGRDAFPEYEDAAAAVEAILEHRREKKRRVRTIRLFRV